MVAHASSSFRAVAARVPRRLVRLTAVVAFLALAGVAVFYSRSVLPSLSELSSPDPSWVVLAVVLELASLSAYALIVKHLLAERDVRARTRELLRATVGGIALGASLPGGQALSTAYWYKLLRREGASRGVAALALAGAMIAGILSLAVLLVAGIAVAGDSGPCAHARVPILCAAGVLLGVRVAIGRQLGRAARRLIARFTPIAAEDLAMSGRRIAVTAGFALLNWLFDCACLLASLHAVGAHVPVRSVLLTYSLAQIVAAIPLLPGGGGTVELSLSLGFAAFGHTSGSVVAGVIFFRLISCWGLIPVGWLAIVLDGRIPGLHRLTLRQSFR